MNTLCNFVRYTKRASHASCCQNDLRASEAKGGTKILAGSRAAIQTEIRYYGDGWMIDQGRVIGLEHLMGEIFFAGRSELHLRNDNRKSLSLKR